MKTSKYIIFTKIIETGSLTAAADALGLTQSGVSHAVNSLEEELGTKLLIRNRNGIKLTGDGSVLFPLVKAVADAREELNRKALEIKCLDAGKIRLGAFTSVAVNWLPGILKSFNDLFPNIEFELINGDYHDISQGLISENIDIGFVTLPLDIPNCECIPLVEDRILAVLPKNHRLKDAGYFPMSALKDEPFISLLEKSDHDARRALDSAGVKPNIKYTTKDDYAIIAMVEQGLGISLMPELLLKGNDDNVVVKPLEKDFKRTIGIAMPRSVSDSPVVRNFADHIKTWLLQKNYKKA